MLRPCLAALGSQLLNLKKQILDFDRMILAWHRSNPTSASIAFPASVRCYPSIGRLTTLL
jgi:hypothetical protein